MNNTLYEITDKYLKVLDNLEIDARNYTLFSCINCLSMI